MKKVILVLRLFLVSIFPTTHSFAGEILSSFVFPSFENENALREENLSEIDLKEIEAGKTIIRSRPMPKGKKGAHVMAAGWTRGSVEQAYSVIMDCKGQPQYIPFLVACANTFAQAVSGGAIINYEQTETLKFGFGFISRQYSYTVNVFTIPPFVRGWTLKGGDISAAEGYWRIIPYKNGHLILLNDVYTDPGSVVPGKIQDILIKHDLPNTVEAYRKRVEIISETVLR